MDHRARAAVPATCARRRATAATCFVLASVLLASCAAPRTDLDLPAGHPADPATAAAPERSGAPAVAALPPHRDAAQGAATEYVCPMHADVRSPTPGTCPKCGMDLQPVRAPAPQPAERPEHADHADHAGHPGDAR